MSDTAPETSSTNPPPSPPAGRWAFVRRLGPAGILSILALALPPVGGAILLTQLEHFSEPLRQNAWGPVICAGGFIILAGFALLPTAVLSVFAGWAFGFVSGTIAATIGFTGAGAIGFWFSGKLSGDGALKVIDEQPRWRAVHRALLGGSAMKCFWIVALLRAPTLPPFAMTSVVLAALKVRPIPFLLGTAAGVAPRTALYAYTASKVQKLNLASSSDLTVLIIGLGGTVVAVLLMTYLARRALNRITDTPESASEPR